MTLRVLLGAALVAIMGCGSPDARVDLPESGGVVDSTLPRDEALRRFRDGLTPVDSLAGGATTRDELVRTFVTALAESDTAGIASLAVTPSEFAHLYYPTAVEGQPPYDLEPALMWFMLVERSNQGARKALAHYGGRLLPLLGYDCGARSHREGKNTIHGPCVVRWTTQAGDTASVRLVSKVLERDGRFKFLSYANQLD